jgi:hypothetical protein
MTMYRHIVYLNAALIVFAVAAPCQQARRDPIQPGTPASSANSSVIEPEPKGIFRMLQNYGIALSMNEFEPMTSAAKFRRASKDAFGPGIYAGAALSAGIAQWNSSNQSFGQGASGFGRYFSAAFADCVIRHYMTDGPLSKYPAPESAILSARRWRPVVQAALCCGPGFLEEIRARLNSTSPSSSETQRQ